MRVIYECVKKSVVLMLNVLDILNCLFIYGNDVYIFLYEFKFIVIINKRIGICFFCFNLRFIIFIICKVKFIFLFSKWWGYIDLWDEIW